MSAKWVASLNNGETIDETKIGNGSSPWLTLVKHCRDNNLYIKHIKIVCNGIEYNSPTYGSIGRFSNSDNVKSFWVCRRQVRNIMGGGPEETYIDLSYKSGNFRHHIIVNETSNLCWQAVSGLDEPWHQNVVTHCGEDW